MGEKKAWAGLAEFFRAGDRKVKLITILGAAGILLIFLSQFWGSEKASSPPETVEEDSAVYVQALQTQMSQLIGQIQGAGKTTVLITLESGWETLYVREEKTDQDSARPSSGEGMVSERLLREESYVLVDGSGGRSALVRTRMEPVVRGVVVVCEGGDDPLTVTRILEAVTTALGVSSAKVCITKCA